VASIERDRLVLEQGERPVRARTLFVDCTASALEKAVGGGVPVFGPGSIALQMIRLCQPTFSAALIGHIEVAVADDTDSRTLLDRVGAHTQLATENLRRLTTNQPIGPAKHRRRPETTA
jgi:hypothetical protein